MDHSASRAAFFRAFPAVGVAIFISSIDQTITATALPAMAAHFGVVERMSWVVVAYLIAATIAAPIIGKLGDAYGRRRMMLVAFGMQAAGSLAAGFAPSFETLLLARILHGFGGGALLTLANALVGESVAPRERGRYQGYLVACFMSASAMGPLAGGWLTQHWGWQWVFLAGLPFVGLGILGALRLPRYGPQSGSFRFDVPGTLLFTVFVTALVLVLDRVQRLSADAMLTALPIAAVALAALLLLMRVETRTADPLLPSWLATDPVIWRTNLCSACVACVMVSMISFMPLYFSVVRGVPIAIVGAMMLPTSLAGGTGALISGQFVARTGRNMLLPSVMLGVSTLMLSALSFTLDAVPLHALPWLMAIASFGYGCSFPAVQTTIQAAAGVSRIGVATASVQFTRNLGSATGTALLSTVIFGAFTLADAPLAADFAETMRGGREALAALAEQDRTAMAAGLSGGFRVMFAAAAVLLGVAPVLAWRVPLRRL